MIKLKCESCGKTTHTIYACMEHAGATARPRNVPALCLACYLWHNREKHGQPLPDAYTEAE